MCLIRRADQGRADELPDIRANRWLASFDRSYLYTVVSLTCSFMETLIVFISYKFKVFRVSMSLNYISNISLLNTISKSLLVKRNLKNNVHLVYFKPRVNYSWRYLNCYL